MESVVLVIHLILALSIIGLVLIQRSEGGGLGIGGGGGGLGGLASARGTANILTRLTGLCAAGFFITSLTLGVLAGGHSKQEAGLLNDINPAEIEAPLVDDVSAPVGVTFIPPSEMPVLPSEGGAEITVPAENVVAPAPEKEAETPAESSPAAVQEKQTESKPQQTE